MRLKVLIINVTMFWLYYGADGWAWMAAQTTTTSKGTTDPDVIVLEKLPTIPETEIAEVLNPGGDAVSPMDYIFNYFNMQNWYPAATNLGYNEYCIEQYIRCALSSVYPHSNCSYYWYFNYWWRYWWSTCAYRMDACRRRFRLFHLSSIEINLPVLNARDRIPMRFYRHLCPIRPNYA